MKKNTDLLAVENAALRRVAVEASRVVKPLEPDMEGMIYWRDNFQPLLAALAALAEAGVKLEDR